MEAIKHCLKQAFRPGSTLSFAVPERAPALRTALAPWVSLCWRLERIPRFSAATEVVEQQFSWWQHEITLANQTSSQHPILASLSNALQRPQIQQALLSYITHLADSAADCQVDDMNAWKHFCEGRRGFLVQALVKLDSTDHAALIELLTIIDLLEGFHRDARLGLIYWPLQILIEHNLSIDDLRSPRPQASPPLLPGTTGHAISSAHLNNKTAVEHECSDGPKRTTAGHGNTSREFWNFWIDRANDLNQQLWTSVRLTQYPHPDRDLLGALMTFAELKLYALNRCFSGGWIPLTLHPKPVPLRTLWHAWKTRSRYQTLLH